MRRIDFVFLIFALYGLILFRFTDSFSELDFEFKSESTGSFRYDRMNEVKKQCRFVISSASELRPENSNNFGTIKQELTFRYGDWDQESGNASILPFDDRNLRKNSPETPLNLISFWVTDVDRDHRTKKYVGVSGSLMMGMTLEGLPAEKPLEKILEFQIRPGHTQLLISFQGIYIETKRNERVLCLLGETMLPSRESDSGVEAWKWVKESYSQPPLLQDDQILLVLRYPKVFTLTSRVIRGELRSLNSKETLKYFDKVRILSQVGKSAQYDFKSEDLVSKACDPYPYHDNFTNVGVNIYKGNEFCEVLERITNAGDFDVVPNWRCNGTNDFCSKLGPFESDSEIRATNGSFKDVKIYMQNVHCEQKPSSGADSIARVAAVFHAAPPLETQYVAAWRSAPSNMTISAEGMWKPSNGQICMVGCLGLVDSEGSSCKTRLCLYIPVSFSLKQRSIITGSLFNIDDRTGASHFPLSFEKLVQPTEMWNFFQNPPRYTYSKIQAAGAILEKNEPFSFGTVVKKSLLKFPKLQDSEDFFLSLSLLSEDLTFHASAIPNPLPSSRPLKADLGMEILSLGPLFGRYWSSGNLTPGVQETPYHTKAQYTEKQLLLNVSAQLSLSGVASSKFSVLFLEGLYDEHVGKMYLVGCRDVRASWKILFDSDDLEAGLDCLIEVVISYPPTTSRWLINPTARISITSQRTEDDPLYFESINLQTLPIIYRRQREDMLSQSSVEGILQILTLSFAITCVLSQLFYTRHEIGSVSFMSLVMLGAQALGYSLPLITGAEALFKRKASDSYASSSYNLEKHEWFYVIDYTVKLLVMALLLLTLRLCQKVWKSRTRLLAGTPHEPHTALSDRRIFILTAIIHIIGYILALIVQSTRTSQSAIQMENFADSTYTSSRWITELEEYIGLVQDFFLLPQVFANFMWQIDCKPLRKLYFLGITVVRLLPHVYDYIRAPDLNPYFADEYEFVNPSFDFFSRSGDMAISVTAILLAATVHLQQSLGYEKLSRVLTFGRLRLLPDRSVAYERLSTKATETELVSGDTVNGDSAHEREEGLQE